MPQPGPAPPCASPARPQVLDARDPLGTRCRHLEQHLKKNARHKHLLLLLNKCDLVSPGGTSLLCSALSEGSFPLLFPLPTIPLSPYCTLPWQCTLHELPFCATHCSSTAALRWACGVHHNVSPQRRGW